MDIKPKATDNVCRAACSNRTFCRNFVSAKFAYFYRLCAVQLSWVELMWPMVCRPIRLGVGHPFGARYQIFLFPFFCGRIALLLVLGRPLWREDGSVSCSATCQWPESQRTRNYTLLSSETTGFPFRRLFRNTTFNKTFILSFEVRWADSSYRRRHTDNRPSHKPLWFLVKYQSNHKQQVLGIRFRNYDAWSL
jgi:hypothetical protein